MQSGPKNEKNAGRPLLWYGRLYAIKKISGLSKAFCFNPGRQWPVLLKEFLMDSITEAMQRLPLYMTFFFFFFLHDLKVDLEISAARFFPDFPNRHPDYNTMK